jgi:integrase
MASIIKRGTKHEPRFYAQFRDANGVRRTKLLKGARNLEQARMMVAAIERNLMHGTLGIEEPTDEQKAQRSITVRDLAARFLGDVEGVAGYAPPKIKNIRNYRSDARSMFKVRILPSLGAREAATIRPGDVEVLRDTLARDLKPASVTQTLAVLSKLYNWARRAGHIDCPNPVQGIERPRAQSSVDFWDRADVARLLGKAEELARLSPSATPEAQIRYRMLVAAIYTGMRKGELFGLRWRDVHLDAGRVDVMRSYRMLPKGGKPRHLPLHPELARVLRAWQRECPVTDDGLVFPVLDDGPKCRWRMGTEQHTLGLPALLEAAGCRAPADGKPWHLARHSFASHAVMSGMSLYELQRLLGHATPLMTQRYAHLAPDHLAGAVARLDFAPAPPAGVTSMDDVRRQRAADKA